ncbi:MAG: tetratricopeptide repeat protein, partial [Planktothrix sp.]
MTKAPDCEIWFEQGMVWQEQENYAQALDCFEKAIACNPHFIPAWVY